MLDSPPKLLAVSDLHVAFAANREFVAELPQTHDWLLVAGDVAEKAADVEWAVSTLSKKFGKVIWSPGNHELWTLPSDPVQLRGVRRYEHLVEMCRRYGVITPEDPYPVWHGAGGPALIAPLFLLYDYTFLPPGLATKEQALDYAYQTGVVCTDEVLLHPDPYPSREAWCRDRVDRTERRLTAAASGLPVVLVSHFPLIREPTEVLQYPEFAQWCGTERTADWHKRFGAVVSVYGHLHMHGTAWHDGVRFVEVSLGYPEEAQLWPGRPRSLTQILPLVPATPSAPPGPPR